MLTQDVKEQIQQAYSRFLQNKKLKPRYGQRQMIAQIARSLGAIERDADDHRINQAGICAIEAGTGTGKTVAYILAVMPVARAQGKKVVISTATIALQEQILHRDLPDILRHSGLQFRFALAKGRGRYICLSKLDRWLDDNAAQQALFAIDNADTPDIKRNLHIYESMAKALLTGSWNGDRDTWPEEIVQDEWQPLTADRNQCAGRRCQHVANCSFIKAREGLSTVDCVVANHDLVMADLALGGGAILPDPADTIYVFDEGHHLAGIALRHFAGQLRINASLHWFDQCAKTIQEIAKGCPSFVRLLDALDSLPLLLVELKQIYARVKPLVEKLVEHLIGDFTDKYQLPFYRFENGQIPQELQELSRLLTARFGVLVDEIMAAHDIIGETLDANDTGIPLAILEQLYATVGNMLNIAERQSGLWQAYSVRNPELPDSRWIQIVESGGMLDFELSTSPLLAANTLQQYLWQRCYAAVLTSATLTALGAFDRLVLHSGLPAWADTLVVPSPFNFMKNARFVVPVLQSDPTNQEQHTGEIVKLLPGLVEGHRGVLVLFASRRQMNDVYELLDVSWQQRVLCQNNMSKQKLIEQHVCNVDTGATSILFGLASFAEGVDLPGIYCTQVVIAKLPFSVPNDPVESALAEWFKAQGRDAFMEISLPDASQRLIQACGRLIRNENDTGQVTLLDKRILTKRYGVQLLNALPPFQRVLGDA